MDQAASAPPFSYVRERRTFRAKCAVRALDTYAPQMIGSLQPYMRAISLA